MQAHVQEYRCKKRETSAMMMMMMVMIGQDQGSEAGRNEGGKNAPRPSSRQAGEQQCRAGEQASRQAMSLVQQTTDQRTATVDTRSTGLESEWV